MDGYRGDAVDLDHVSQAWPAGMAWPRAPSEFAMYRKTISCWRLPGARPGWLAWPGRARHQHSLCTGRTSSCRKPSFVKGAGPKPGITNLLSTGKPIPCRKPPFVKGAGPGPGIRNLLSTEKPSPCRKPPFVKGAGPGPGIGNLLSTGKLSPCRKPPFVKGARPGRPSPVRLAWPDRARARHRKSAKYWENELL